MNEHQSLGESASGKERVVLVHIHFPAGNMEEDLDEFKELAMSAGALVVGLVTGTRRVPESKYFVGTGKADEIREAVLAHKADLVIFNHVLTPAQERNLERLISCRVVDRTGLILDIFAQRARSFEGKLQVELALLSHLSTRLVRGWTHLERQRGGIGLRGGPGETQLEVDRRLIRQRMKVITARLAKIRMQREQGRRARRKAIVPTVALVGYTNAGKSTLFNKLTGSSVYVANQLFATLDPTLRRIDFPTIGPVILADTVGFIRHLPHDLVEAFHATLEEVSEADLLLHVVDAQDENKQYHHLQVDQVLESIEAKSVPRLMVYNKIDLVPDAKPGLVRDEQGQIRRVFISAAKGWGLDELALAIGEMLGKKLVEQTLVLLPKHAKLRAELYAREAIVSETIDEAGNYCLVVRLPQEELDRLLLTLKL
jgi:GTPase